MDDEDTIELRIAKCSSIDIGINNFNNKDAIVIFIRPDQTQTTRWLNNARGLETRTFGIEVNELKDRLLESLRGDETYLFPFETPTPTYGYIFDIDLKIRLYDIVKGLKE